MATYPLRKASFSGELNAIICLILLTQNSPNRPLEMTSFNYHILLVRIRTDVSFIFTITLRHLHSVLMHRVQYFFIFIVIRLDIKLR